MAPERGHALCAHAELPISCTTAHGLLHHNTHDLHHNTLLAIREDFGFQRPQTLI